MSRLKSGISGLDEMLHGGFLEGDAVMVAGSAGTGKTTLALECLVNGITKFGETGLYVTFEQLPDQIYRDAQNFGWDLRGLERENKLRIVCTSPSLMVGQEGGGEELLGETIREMHPRRVVIDSLSHLSMYVPERELRMETYRLVRHFKTKGISSMSLWETPQTMGTGFSVSDAGLSFLVDTILILRQVEIESTVRRMLAVVKMRGSDHDKRLREYEITSHGVQVSAPFSEYEGLLTGSPRKSLTAQAANNWALAFETSKHKHSSQ